MGRTARGVKVIKVGTGQRGVVIYFELINAGLRRTCQASSGGGSADHVHLAGLGLGAGALVRARGEDESRFQR